MGAFENTLSVYKEVSQEHSESPKELELLGVTFFQKAWADKKCSELKVTDESEREAATVEWMTELGEWFRVNILESTERIGETSRKEYFLKMFDTDPAKAISELDELFMSMRH